MKTQLKAPILTRGFGTKYPYGVFLDFHCHKGGFLAQKGSFIGRSCAIKKCCESLIYLIKHHELMMMFDYAIKTQRKARKCSRNESGPIWQRISRLYSHSYNLCNVKTETEGSLRAERSGRSGLSHSPSRLLNIESTQQQQYVKI